MSNHLESIFPRLRETVYKITSPAQPDYNCVAWAVGDDSRWWWPDASGQYYWPEKAPRHETMDAFIETFQGMGFEVCEDDSWQPEWEKVALYASGDGTPTHAARQLPNGAWTSKLGNLEDIQHQSLDDVSGNDYGRPAVILRRRKQMP